MILVLTLLRLQLCPVGLLGGGIIVSTPHLTNQKCSVALRNQQLNQQRGILPLAGVPLDLRPKTRRLLRHSGALQRQGSLVTVGNAPLARNRLHGKAGILCRRTKPSVPRQLKATNSANNHAPCGSEPASLPTACATTNLVPQRSTNSAARSSEPKRETLNSGQRNLGCSEQATVEQPNAETHSAVPAKHTAASSAAVRNVVACNSVVVPRPSHGMHSNVARCDHLSINTLRGKDQVLRNAPSRHLARHSAELPNSVARVGFLTSATVSSAALHRAPRNSAPANNKTLIQMRSGNNQSNGGAAP